MAPKPPSKKPKTLSASGKSGKIDLPDSRPNAVPSAVFIATNDNKRGEKVLDMLSRYSIPAKIVNSVGPMDLLEKIQDSKPGALIMLLPLFDFGDIIFCQELQRYKELTGLKVFALGISKERLVRHAPYLNADLRLTEPLTPQDLEKIVEHLSR